MTCRPHDEVRENTEDKGGDARAKGRRRRGVADWGMACAGQDREVTGPVGSARKQARGGGALNRTHVNEALEEMGWGGRRQTERDAAARARERKNEEKECETRRDETRRERSCACTPTACSFAPPSAFSNTRRSTERASGEGGGKAAEPGVTRYDARDRRGSTKKKPNRVENGGDEVGAVPPCTG